MANLQEKTLEVFVESSSAELTSYIESATSKPKTAYQLVTRVIGFHLSVGVRNMSVQSVIEDALAIVQARKIKGITFDALYDAMPHVVAALVSPDPMTALQI